MEEIYSTTKFNTPIAKFNTPIAKFKVGEKVRLVNDHNISFIIEKCVESNTQYQKTFIYSAGNTQVCEEVLELCPKKVKIKFEIWRNFFVDDNNDVCLGAYCFDTKEKATPVNPPENYLCTKHFECECEVEVKLKE